jgi:hypothetical protein
VARVPVTGRITLTQSAVLDRYARDMRIPKYQAVNRALEAGIANLLEGAKASDTDTIVLEALGRLSAQVDRIEGYSKRALYASGAAYAVGLRVAFANFPRDQHQQLKAAVVTDADRIFERQTSLALEQGD